MKKTKRVLYDPFIIGRVNKYLEENVNQSFLDVGQMTKALQERYPEYARRKYAPFRALVDQAFNIVSESYGLGANALSDNEDSEGSDVELLDDTEKNNLVRNMMKNLYDKQPKPKTQTDGKPLNISAEGFGPIDISSEESDEERETVQNGNAPTTSAATTSTTLVKNSNPLPNLTNYQQLTVTQLPVDKDHADSSSKSNLEAILKKPVQKRRNPSENGHPNKKNKTTNDNSGLQQPHPKDYYPPGYVGMRPRKYKKEVELGRSRYTFTDVGGMEKTLKELCELLLHIRTPDIYFALGLSPPRGILLHGPTGCGKTMLAQAIAGQLGFPIINIPATELVAGVSGESEERIRDVFEQAVTAAPCVLFIDEIDAISTNRSLASKDMERRVVSQLISSLDSLRMTEGGQYVIVIGATTRPNALDPGLRRVGRFDHEIAIGIPSRKDRKDILQLFCESLSIDSDCDFEKLAELTPGYVGADLLSLVSRAASNAIKKKYAQNLYEIQSTRDITIVDLEEEDSIADKSALCPDAENTEKQNNASDDAENRPASDDQNATTSEGTQKDGATEAMQVDDEPKEDSELVEESKDKEANSEVNATAPATTPPPETKADKVKEAVKREPSLLEYIYFLDTPPEDLNLGEFCIRFEDFVDAIKTVQPTAKREGFITVPDVTWDDIGSLKEIREELKLAVLAPVKFPEKLEALGLSIPSGVLLCGPPGCGKTLLAKAVANEAGINFISVKGPEFMNMYVGESERAVRDCFQRARNSAPCVIFFDEFDALCPKRSETNEGSAGTRVVNQLLTEMDGIENRKGVYILAATNRPDIIDPAILRPGRLDTILFVGLPELKDRIEIMTATTKNRKKPLLDDDVDFEALAMRTENYTGADLAGLVRKASMIALKESLNNTGDVDDLRVNQTHFDEALKLLRPSISEQDRKVYDTLRIKYSTSNLQNGSSTC